MGLANLKQVRTYIDVAQRSNESVRSKIGDILRILVGRAVRPRRSSDCMGLPGEWRPVIHREWRIIRRISREDLQDRAQDSAIDDYHLLRRHT
jgi:hypothetical protein